MFDLYLITPDLAPRVIVERCTRALAAVAHGRIGVQLRSKQLDARERGWLAHELRALTRSCGADLVVNTDVALAREVGADGVQLPERSADLRATRAQNGPVLSIGASRHDLAGVLAAAADGATFVTLSPIFDVPDKGAPLGLEGLSAIAAQSGVPLIALGGIDALRARDAVRAGAHGVAVIREVWDSDDPARSVAQLLVAIERGRSDRTL